MAVTTTLSGLKINILTDAQLQAAITAGTINVNELYFVPDTGVAEDSDKLGGVPASGYAKKISVVPSTSTTPTISTAATGTIYTFSNALTSLTISANPSAPFWYRIDFTAGGTFTPTYAATPTWNGATAPTITSGKKYSLIITDHISSYAEA